MAEHGGYRQPANPAPVSGPGALSKRTDGGPGHGQPVRQMTGLPYGDAQAFQQQQAAAPMSQQGSVPSPAPSAVASAAQAPSQPFARPTDLPGQPVTHGVDIGPGAAAATAPPSGLNAPPDGAVTSALRALSGRDATGVLAALLDSASIRGV